MKRRSVRYRGVWLTGGKEVCGVRRRGQRGSGEAGGGLQHLWMPVGYKAYPTWSSDLFRVRARRRTLALAMAHPSASGFDNFNWTQTNTMEPTNLSDVYENSISNLTFVDIFMEQLALTLTVYYTPLLIVLGTVGNLLSIFVFFRSKLRLQSTSQYLSALALSDTLFLLVLLPPWLKAVGISTLFSQSGYCQLFAYITYVTSHYSSWLVVAFTVERFVAVVYPLRRNAVCTVKRARYIVVSLAATALLVNLPLLWFAVASGDDCNIDELLMTPAARFNMVDTIVSFTLPLAIIIILNSWIMSNVYRVNRTQGHLMRQQRECRVRALTLTQEANPRINIHQQSQQRVTRMLLIVSSVFVLLNLPAYSMRIAAYAYNMREHEYSGRWAELQQICLIFFNTNFGINFLLYCLSGQNFRRSLQETIPWMRRNRLALAVLGQNTDRTARASSISMHSFNNHAEGVTCAERERREAEQCEAERHELERREAEQQDAIPIRQRRSLANLNPFRQRPPQIIQRWRFDNSRQVRREAFEMQDRRAGAAQPPAGNF